MQVKSFKQLLDKYNDVAINPGAEPMEKVMHRMSQDTTDYYLIQLDKEAIGAIRIDNLPDDICRISPIFILPEFQGEGYAQQAITAVEKLYPLANGWQLDTIKEEEKLCHLYEKMGYKKTAKEEVIQRDMTIAYYAK